MIDPTLNSSTQLEVFPDQLRLCRIEPDMNMNRYYFMTVQRDLFGGASLIREWGRIGSAGQVQVTHHDNEGRAVDMLADFFQSKAKRGYAVWL